MANLGLVGVILIALFLGKIARFLLERLGEKVEGQQRLVAGITLRALGRGIIFLFASIGIVLDLPILELKSRVADLCHTISAVLLTIGVGYFLYWLAEIPSAWLAEMKGV